MGLFGPSQEEIQQRIQQRRAQEEAAQARRERQVRITRADVEEVERICLSALKSARVGGDLYIVDDCKVTEARLTRGGLIIRGAINAHTKGLFPKYYNLLSVSLPAMRKGLHSLGYLADEDFGDDGLIVTGWDPLTYEGTQLTPARIDERIAELQQIRAEVEAFQDQAEEPATPGA